MTPFTIWSMNDQRGDNTHMTELLLYDISKKGISKKLKRFCDETGVKVVRSTRGELKWRALAAAVHACINDWVWIVDESAVPEATAMMMLSVQISGWHEECYPDPEDAFHKVRKPVKGIAGGVSSIGAEKSHLFSRHTGNLRTSPAVHLRNTIFDRTLAGWLYSDHTVDLIGDEMLSPSIKAWDLILTSRQDEDHVWIAVSFGKVITKNQITHRSDDDGIIAHAAKGHVKEVRSFFEQFHEG